MSPVRAAVQVVGRRMDAEDYRLRDFLTLPLEASRVGLFAAGEVRHGSTKRVAAAVGEGSMVAALVFTRLAELGVAV